MDGLPSLLNHNHGKPLRYIILSPLFCYYCTGDPNNGSEKEDCVPGIRAFSERYVFFASDGRKRSAIMPAEQHNALATKWRGTCQWNKKKEMTKHGAKQGDGEQT